MEEPEGSGSPQATETISSKTGGEDNTTQVVITPGGADVDHGTLSTTEAAKLMNGLNLDGSVISAITDHASLEGHGPHSSNNAGPLPSILNGGGNSVSDGADGPTIVRPDPEVPKQVAILPDDQQHQQQEEEHTPITDDDVPSIAAASAGGGGADPVSSSTPSKQHEQQQQLQEQQEPVTLIVTEQPAGDENSIASTSALPDPPSSLDAAAENHGAVPNSIRAHLSPQREHLRAISISEGMPSTAGSAPTIVAHVTVAAAAAAAASDGEQGGDCEQGDDQEEQTEQTDTDSAVDDYIRSPEVQNAIVERSPGGRYVRFMEKLGSGASKDVYRAYDTQEGIEVAWNVVTLSGVPKTERNRIVNEVRLLERLHHHNIISFHGSWVNRERQEVNFVTEILSSGTLKSFINKVQVIRWKIAKRWAVQILNGLEYLHSQDPPVIHRDLKCENIFINGTSGDLRIGDLGLSTVHRNGRVLSVLGTPEFMAPDMYEEDSYDEKVDIYAFGLCMLEIFTQQIPYSECSNPAQIYKKVSSGEPPEILSRLQSRHAREFVMLCLGHKDENGKYVRPSASELLKHPFLERRLSDDDEVVVEKPLRERAIVEASGESSTSPDGTPSSRRKIYSYVDSSTHATSTAGTAATGSQIPQNSSSTHAVSSNTTASPPPPPPRRRNRPLNSFDEDDDGDRFDEMPESETNMKKVKVLMGRGQELEEDDSEPQPEMDDSNNTGAGPSQQQQQPSPPPGGPQDTTLLQQQYLVAAAVIENEAMIVRPYADDILKLVVTLPVEGQTQNVQFDFHLVLDDPVQVAKEMVQELGIPQGAVLEISETISGLACAARMKQDKHSMRQQNPVQTQQQPQQHVIAQPPAPSTAQGVQNGSQEISQSLSQVSSASPVPDYGGNQVLAGNAPQPAHLGIPDGSSVVVQGQAAGAPPQVYVPPQNAPYTAPPQQATESTQHYGQAQVSNPTPANIVVPQPQAPSLPASHPGHGLSPAKAAAPGPPQPATGVRAAASAAVQPTNHVPVVRQTEASQTSSGPSSPLQTISKLPPRQSLPPEMAVPFQAETQREVPLRTRSQSSEQSPGSKQEISGAASANVEDDDSDSDDDDDEINEELRKLDEDFHKNLERTKKVFDSRMDNLQRSQVEREAQHLKTLEKHEKERAEFEKRRAIEEEQQQRRLEQMQKEWDKKRETLAQHKRKHHGHMTTDQESHQPEQQQKKSSAHVPRNGSHQYVEDSQDRAPLGTVPQKPGNPSRNISAPSSAVPISSSQHPVDNKQHGQANGGLDR